MFTESEANALITVEQLVVSNKDQSLIQKYQDAIQKVKAVLQYATKEKLEMLEQRLAVSPMKEKSNTSSSLVVIQEAITNYKVLNINYKSQQNALTERTIEPFALYYSLEENWTLIAYCRLRNDYRMFRLDRLVTIQITEHRFSPHNITLQQYLAHKEKNFHTPDISLS